MANGLFLGGDGSSRPVDVDCRGGLAAAAEVIGAQTVELLPVTAWGLECALLVDEDGHLDLHKRLNMLASWFMRSFALFPYAVVGDALVVGYDPARTVVDVAPEVVDFVTAWRARIVEDVAPL